MTPWVVRLIAANIVVFLLQSAFPHADSAFVLVPALILQQPWSVVTYMFLHAGMGHLFFNMLMLFFFGPQVEARLGGRNFLILYFASGLGGAALSFIQPSAGVVGASGAIFGVFLAYARYWPRVKVFIWGVLPIEARWLVVLMTAISVLGGFGAVEPGIAHYAHLGGFVGGYLSLRFIERRSTARRWQQVATPMVRRVAADAGAVERWARIPRESLHEVNRDELDRILDKLRAGGVGSLSPGDREFLDRFTPGE